MINDLAYETGKNAAWAVFTKSAGPTIPLPRLKPAAAGLGNVVGGQHPLAGTVAGRSPMAAAPAGGGTQVLPPKGAAPMPAPAAAPTSAPGAAPAKPGFMDSWKGQLAMSVGAPLAMNAIQSAMTPAPPVDPNIPR